MLSGNEPNEKGAERRSYRHLIYALISVACPFIALGVIAIYHGYAYAEFFRPRDRPIDDAAINAGAMMGAVILIEAILSIGLGSVVGLVFGGLSLKYRPKIISFGTAALLFNALPIALVIRLYVGGL